jgi:hypothetical protein
VNQWWFMVRFKKPPRKTLWEPVPTSNSVKNIAMRWGYLSMRIALGLRLGVVGVVASLWSVPWASAADSAGGEVLKNPGFDEGAGGHGAPEGWSIPPDAASWA